MVMVAFLLLQQQMRIIECVTEEISAGGFFCSCVVVHLQLLQLLASSEQEFWNTMCSHNSWVSTRCDQS